MGRDRDVTVLQQLYEVDLSVAQAIYRAFEGNKSAFYVLEFLSLTGDGILYVMAIRVPPVLMHPNRCQCRWILTVLPLLIVAWVFGFMKSITPGQSLFLVFFYMCMLVCTATRHLLQRIIVLLMSTLSFQVDIICIILFKLFFRRARPPHHKTDARFAGPDQHSFPSGHATRSWCLVGLFVYLGAYYPLALADTLGAWSVKAMPILIFFWAVAICFCRLALGRHYPSDVLAGSLIGLFVIFPITAILMQFIAPAMLEAVVSV
ncbi:Aste57867_13376 [Aphanomyces stellatus]|uniref:Aste57867_13376 protein n=1 Tax=Aphanomyces stellatus TaxID=120398 RepID=A0A485KYQ0_9STRA|nr:hypothetical protein As57867_013326 [Aphanomyces stellatus]VFT90215.1 Aste57867_13376 [Aphanomyces stellatus]